MVGLFLFRGIVFLVVFRCHLFLYLCPNRAFVTIYGAGVAVAFVFSPVDSVAIRFIFVFSHLPLPFSAKQANTLCIRHPYSNFL